MAASQTYGIIGLADIGSDALLADVGRETIQNVITTTLAQHNAAINQFLSPFGDLTDEYKKRLLTAGGGKLQTSDENSRARVTKGSAYDVALPILQGAAAWGSNYVTLQKMSVKRFAQALEGMLNKDRASVRDLVYGAMFHNVNWTHVDDEYGSLTIKTLANGDTDTYPVVGASDLATDTHYLATASAIADVSNPFPAIRDELLEHGDDLGDVIAFIPTSAQTAVSALTEFVPISNNVVIVGTGESRISRAGPSIDVPGTVIGYLANSRTWVVVLRTLPTAYLIAITENGDRPLAFRQDKQEKLRGFKPAGEVNDFPYFEEQWLRRIGAGAWNRVGAVVQYFGVSGTYAIPSGYTPKVL